MCHEKKETKTKAMRQPGQVSGACPRERERTDWEAIPLSPLAPPISQVKSLPLTTHPGSFNGNNRKCPGGPSLPPPHKEEVRNSTNLTVLCLAHFTTSQLSHLPSSGTLKKQIEREKGKPTQSVRLHAARNSNF